MPLTAVLNKMGLSVRRLKDGKSFFDKKLLKLTGLEHFAHDVASADEFALDVELRDRRPVGVDLDAIPQFGRVVHIERLVSDPDIFENLDQLTRKPTLWKLRRAFHEEHDVVRPYFVLDELFDAHDLISYLHLGTATAPLITRVCTGNAFAVEANNRCCSAYIDDNNHVMKLQSASVKKKLVMQTERNCRHHEAVH